MKKAESRRLLRERTRMIIRKKGEYLCFVNPEIQLVRFSLSPWDAWWTRSTEAARAVAARVRGEIVLFNPLSGEYRQFHGER